jgi:hypothetical protein
MKVRKSFTDPDYSPFTKECVKVGESLEVLGYKLDNEYYSQGEQTFNFRKGAFRIHVAIEEAD